MSDGVKIASKLRAQSNHWHYCVSTGLRRRGSVPQRVAPSTPSCPGELFELTNDSCELLLGVIAGPHNAVTLRVCLSVVWQYSSQARILIVFGRLRGSGQQRAPLDGYVQGMHDIASVLFLVFLRDGLRKAEDLPPVTGDDCNVGQVLRRLQPATLRDVEADTFFCLHALLSYVPISFFELHALRELIVRIGRATLFATMIVQLLPLSPSAGDFIRFLIFESAYQRHCAKSRSA